ncbi:MAG: FkbM family methyltransferase [Candidatus Aegiribacteria sp.]|nr:FkbM family methyltransferase [Candidatus Aegiribacteria sp.]
MIKSKIPALSLYLKFKYLMMKVLYRHPLLFNEIRFRFWITTLKTGVRNEKELKVLPRLVTPGMTVIDIGAHCGRYTIPLSYLVGQRGRVLSFEQVTTNYRILERLKRKYGLTNVVLFKEALVEHSGKGIIAMPITSNGIYSYSCSSILQDDSIDRSICKLHQCVEIDTLDNIALTDSIDRCGYMKIDVEGYELFVLRGGVELLDRFRPVVQCEIIESHTLEFEYRPDDLVSFMNDMGYEMYIYSNGLEHLHEVTPDTLITSLFRSI